MIINDFLRSVGIFFDSLIYGLIGSLYELFMDIAATQVFANGTIESFANRVYALLAIFMLFRLSFSFLTYIITPDAASDKNSGAGKLIGNILITMVLLISTPWLFTQVLQLQNDLLRDNIVGKIILGSKATDASSQMQAGDTMAWETFSAFFYPREDICENGLSDQGACIGKLNGEIADKTIEVSGMKLGEAYERIANAKSVKGISKNGLVNIKDANDEYVFEYIGFISLIAGGFVAYILLLFSIQIAVRTIKLGVLQLIAPIPIISYLDPKQGKDGMFKKWLKTCGKTFVDLFIRLAAIYFAIFVITEITKGGGLQNTLTGAKTTGFAKVLVILGALTFAKDLPKFIEEITGIKFDSGFSLNPMKTLGAIPLVGGGLAAGAAFGFGAAKTGLWAAGQTAKAGIQTGAGKIFGKQSWQNAGQSTLRGIREGGLARIQATTGEAAGRFRASGFAGTDKYSGETMSATIRKQKQELRDTAKKGQVEIAQKNRQWDYGRELAIQTKGKIEDAFGSQKYRESYENVELKKADFNAAKARLAKVEKDPTSTLDQIQAAQKEFATTEKLYNVAKSTHESLGKTYKSDAEKEAAFGYFKDSGGVVDPTKGTVGDGGARPTPKK